MTHKLDKKTAMEVRRIKGSSEIADWVKAARATVNRQPNNITKRILEEIARDHAAKNKEPAA